MPRARPRRGASPRREARARRLGDDGGVDVLDFEGPLRRRGGRPPRGRRCSRRPSSARRCSGSSGPCRPPPRRPGARRRSRGSRSRRRSGPRGRGRTATRTPPSISGRPGTSRCASKPLPTRKPPLTPAPLRRSSASAQARSSGVVSLRFRGRTRHRHDALAQALDRHRLVGQRHAVAEGLLRRRVSAARSGSPAASGRQRARRGRGSRRRGRPERASACRRRAPPGAPRREPRPRATASISAGSTNGRAASCTSTTPANPSGACFIPSSTESWRRAPPATTARSLLSPTSIARAFSISSAGTTATIAPTEAAAWKGSALRDRSERPARGRKAFGRRGAHAFAAPCRDEDGEAIHKEAPPRGRRVKRA